MEVETLIPQMQETLSKIRTTVSELSSKSHYDELDQLEQKRERLLADSQTSFEKEVQKLEAKRQQDLEDIKKKRKQEDEERAARRQREDEELQKAKSKEHKQQQRKYDSEVDSIEDETERKMDEIEEIAERVVEEGKKKLHDLEEKRKDLNHRIDEQLKQSLPTTPPRKRDRPKKEGGDHSKDGVNGGSASAGPRNNDSSSKSQPSTPSKPRPSSAVSAQEKSPEAKKDGEEPFQDRTIGPLQAAKKHAENLPRSFAEVLKNNISNESKGKPELEKTSPAQAVQKQTSRGEYDSEKPSIQQDLVASSGETELTKVEGITRDGQVVENTESLSSELSKLGKSQDHGDQELSCKTLPAFQLVRSNDEPHNSSSERKTEVGLEQINDIYTENLPGSQPVLPKRPGPIISNVEESKHATEIQLWRDQIRKPEIDETDSEQSNRIATSGETPEKSDRSPMENHAAAHTSEADMHTVETSPAVQSSRLSSPSDKPSSRQGNKTRDQVELEQPTIPDLLEQDKPGGSRGPFEALTRPETPAQFSQTSSEPAFSAPPSPIQGGLVLSLSGVVSDFSPKRVTPIGFEHIQDSNSEYLHVIGQQAKGKCASPLPVENETVWGQDQLFDDNKSACDLSEPDTGEEESDLLPNPPIEGQHTPVLIAPSSKKRLCDQGLTTLIGEFDSWGILTERINDYRSRSFSSNSSPVQESGGRRRLETQTKSGTDDSQDDSHDKPRPKINIHWPPTHELPSPVTPGSLIHHTLREPTDNESRSDHHPQHTYCIDDQGSSHSQPTSMRMLSQVLSGLVGSSSNPDSSSRNTAIVDTEAPKHNPPRSTIKSRTKRSHQRGRQKNRSFQSPEREFNPREQLFQGSDDDINIKSSWFKRSKRGLS